VSGADSAPDRELRDGDAYDHEQRAADGQRGRPDVTYCSGGRDSYLRPYVVANGSSPTIADSTESVRSGRRSGVAATSRPAPASEKRIPAPKRV
jgi:hypothetical protein